MIDSITRITLNLQETNTMVSIRAKRGDTGRKLLIHLSDGSIPYHISDDCYATFTAKKPDGTKINNACTIENNVIEYEFTEQTCAAVGTMKAEIRLYGADDKMITSACFLINVYDTVFREGDEVSSEGEMNILDALICDANELIQDVQQKLDNGDFVGETGPQGPVGATGPQGEHGKDYILTEEDKVEIAAMAAGLVEVPDSGGDSSAFYIAISEENGSYVMDKTFPELKEAHEAGRPVYAIVNVTVENSRVNNAIFQFSNVFDAFFVFTYFGNGMLFTAYVNQDGISFRVKRYAEESSIPANLPNPNALTFTGAVSGTYDGSGPVTIDIPNASGGKSAYEYAQDAGYTGSESDFAKKLAEEPLRGFTSEITPQQVYDAVTAGRNVVLIYSADDVDGVIFTGFVPIVSAGIVTSSGIVSEGDIAAYFNLVGIVDSGEWHFSYNMLPSADSIPEIPDALPNPNALTFTGAVSGTYDGSDPVTIDIPNASGGNVAYDEAQKLTDEQKAQARENIGILEPLIGKADDIKPKEVLAALQEGRDIVITYTDGTYGDIEFTGFSHTESSYYVIATCITRSYSDPLLLQLRGQIAVNRWYFNSDILAKFGDTAGGSSLGITGATVGQTVKISAVDENGTPTAWEPTDFPSGGGSGGNVDQCAPFDYQEPSANLFDKSDIISGQYFDIDGTLKPLSGYGSSGLVKCSPNTTYTKYLFGGKVTFYDSAKCFIGGENNDTNYITTPAGCRYFRVSFSLTNIDRCMILKGNVANPSALEYVAYNKGYIKSDLLTVLQENLSEDLIAWMVQKFGSPKIRVNPTEPLNITTYAGGNNQPTHPKALYFPNGWNGHKYWMVYTPYPGNNNQQENPCITYSDDGLNWSENGISNPIATAPSGGYNSDTHIVVVDGTMECWWREVVSNEEIIVRKKSTNGIDWGEREELFRTGTYTANDCVSPAVIYDEGKYKIWVVYQRNCLKYYESTDGSNWQYVRDIAVNPPGSSYKIWHFDIIKTSKGYEFVGCYQLNGSFDKNNFIYYSTSQNNIGYKYPVRILTNGYDGRFDRLELYRPCLLKINDGTDHEYYNLYYGAQGALRNWAIGLVQASDIESLKCYIDQEAFYVNGYLEADTETEEPDVPDIPDEPDGPEVTLTSISATYSGGNVAVGTAVTALSGIVVTAHYSDGTVSVVTGYTLSGNIAEGSNTITVSYGGKTTTFTVTGIAESDEPKEIVINNLFTHSAANQTGYYDAASGEFKTDEKHCSSDFIPVEPGDNIEFTGVSAAYFDANKNYVSGISYNIIVPKSAVVPAGVAFISFAYYKDNINQYLLVLPVKEANIAIGEDVATSDNIDLTGFYAYGVFKTDSTYGTLKMTNVSPGMVFAATNANTATFYNSNKENIGVSSYSWPVTVPKAAVYMAVSFNKSKTLSVVRTA